MTPHHFRVIALLADPCSPDFASEESMDAFTVQLYEGSNFQEVCRRIGEICLSENVQVIDIERDGKAYRRMRVLNHLGWIAGRDPQGVEPS